MALNIPFNLASITTLQSQPNSMAAIVASAAKVTTVQPAGSGADTRGATSDGAGDRGQSGGTHWLQMSKPRTPMMVKPDRATPTSVVNAQTQGGHSAEIAQARATFDSAATAPATNESIEDRPNKVDRYAPPDPLPTAPILKHRAAAALKQA